MRPSGLPTRTAQCVAGQLRDLLAMGAFAVIRAQDRAPTSGIAIAGRCTEDLLVYLALGRFRRRPPMTALPIGLQRDIRAFFGSYTKACRQADDLLFRAGNAEAVDEACRQSPVGKLLPNALYVHRSALESLEPLLRVYEGCAGSYLGEIDGANLIMLHRHSGQGFVSGLSRLRDRSAPVACAQRQALAPHPPDRVPRLPPSIANPPILHRKETFLTPDHPLHARFARLTAQEEKHGLLDDPAAIGTNDGWQARLKEAGFALRGHRLIRRN